MSSEGATATGAAEYPVYELFDDYDLCVNLPRGIYSHGFEKPSASLQQVSSRPRRPRHHRPGAVGHRQDCHLLHRLSAANQLQPGGLAGAGPRTNPGACESSPEGCPRPGRLQPRQGPRVHRWHLRARRRRQAAQGLAPGGGHPRARLRHEREEALAGWRPHHLRARRGGRDAVAGFQGPDL